MRTSRIFCAMGYGHRSSHRAVKEGAFVFGVRGYSRPSASKRTARSLAFHGETLVLAIASISESSVSCFAVSSSYIPCALSRSTRTPRKRMSRSIGISLDSRMNRSHRSSASSCAFCFAKMRSGRSTSPSAYLATMSPGARQMFPFGFFFPKCSMR